MCLERIDEMVQNGAEMSATTVLALIALFTCGDSIWIRDLADHVPQASDLGERLSSAFTRLTVPRKERERIQMLLTLWGRVRSVAPKLLKAGSYKRSTLLPDLISLIEITQFSREDAQRLQLLSALLHNDSHEHHDHQQKPTHLRRRP
jgi:hypothetical protein